MASPSNSMARNEAKREKGKSRFYGLIQGKRRYSSGIRARLCEVGPSTSGRMSSSQVGRFGGVR